MLTSAAKNKDEEAAPLNTVAVEKMDLAKKVTLSGSVKSADVSTVKSTLSGVKVQSVKVKVGDAVKEGQSLAVLEAMKMENDINSPCAGTVASVNVTKGQAVETGTLVCVIG